MSNDNNKKGETRSDSEDIKTLRPAWCLRPVQHMHVVCSQETVVAAHSRDDKGWGVRCEAEGGLGGGRGWVGVVGALAISFKS